MFEVSSPKHRQKIDGKLHPKKARNKFLNCDAKQAYYMKKNLLVHYGDDDEQKMTATTPTTSLYEVKSTVKISINYNKDDTF